MINYNIKHGMAVLSALFILACGGVSAQKQVTASDFSKKMVELPNYILLDVRSPEEFKTNHIKGAQNINVNAPDFNEKIALLSNETPILLYCKSGGRSATASKSLNKMGLEVYELDGGILAWQAQGLPIEVDEKKSNSGFTMASYTKAINSADIVLVDFYATWCGPCKMMAPHLESLQKKYIDEIKLIKVDTDKSIEVSQNFKISAIPLIKLYVNGAEVYNQSGYHSQEALQALLNKYL